MMKKILTIFIMAMLLLSCTKDDADGADPINGVGGEVFRSQIVNVNLGNTTLLENEYNGIFAGIETRLIKNMEGQLQFFGAIFHAAWRKQAHYT